MRHGLGRRERQRLPRSLRELGNRLIASSSLVPNDPVLDVRDFPWTQLLRDRWQTIRDETARAASGGGLAQCPRTQAILAAVPGIEDAALAVFAPGSHRLDLGGRSKGLLTCHLGLAVPRNGDARLRVKDRVLRWAEGETLVFDATQGCEAWNDADDACLVLAIRFRRPLRNPGKWIAERLLRIAR